MGVAGVVSDLSQVRAAPALRTDKHPEFTRIVKKWGPIFQSELQLKGFHVDGIFGNLGHESLGFTKFHEIGQPDDKGGFGWEQATGPRAAQFKSFLVANHYVTATGEPNIASEGGNAHFIIQELKTTEHAALVALRSTRTRDEATRIFMEKAERPGVPSKVSRLMWARLAEIARLEQEGETVTDGSGSPAVAPQAAQLVNTLRNMEQLLQDLATKEAVSHGIPAFIPPLIESVIDKIGLPELIASEIEKVGLTNFVVQIVSAFRK